MMLLGRYQGLSYKAGDRLTVTVRHIDFILQECSWQLVSHSDEPGEISGEKRTQKRMPPHKGRPPKKERRSGKKRRR
jgi:hypothetical protein